MIHNYIVLSKYCVVLYYVLPGDTSLADFWSDTRKNYWLSWLTHASLYTIRLLLWHILCPAIRMGRDLGTDRAILATTTNHHRCCPDCFISERDTQITVSDRQIGVNININLLNYKGLAKIELFLFIVQRSGK